MLRGGLASTHLSSLTLRDTLATTPLLSLILRDGLASTHLSNLLLRDRLWCVGSHLRDLSAVLVPLGEGVTAQLDAVT